MKKRALIWLIAIVLAVILSIMGTIAYLTDVVGVTNVMTVGNVDIELLEYERTSVDDKDADAKVRVFTQDKPLYPAVVKDGFSYSGLDYSNPTAYVDWTSIGKNDYQTPIWDPDLVNNEVDKMVFVKNTGDNDAYVRVFYAFEVGAYTNLKQFEEKVHLNKNDTDWEWEWDKYIAKQGNSKFFIAVATYNRALAPNDITEVSLSQILLDPVATNVDVKSFGDYFDVHIFAQAIQTQSFDGPESALETGFGSEIPFPDMTIYRGEELKTALNNFEANITNPEKITSKVTQVTFGTKEQYPDIVNDETLAPTLTINGYNTESGKEYGAPTHTYYVPDGENYKLYVLADEGLIYAPENSTKLFTSMSALTEVDTSNFDVSKVTNMHSMFRDCISLKSVDVSNWDVSKVTNMTFMFHTCPLLNGLDVSNWDVGQVTDMEGMFFKCESLTGLDVENWDVGNATTMESMFNGCKALAALDVSKWEVNSLTSTQQMFRGCASLVSLDLSGWSAGNVKDMSHMFRNCTGLTSVNVNGLNTANVANMGYMFSSCIGLTQLDVSGWNTANVTNMEYMFYLCGQIKELDVSKWSTAKVTDMKYMFYNCTGLTSLNVSGWNTANVTDTCYMFSSCIGLTQLDVSDWNTANVTNMGYMFYNCKQISALDVSKWSTAKVTSMAYLFAGCSALTELSVENWDVSNATTMENMFDGCSGLTSLDLSAWGEKVNGVTTMKRMFRNCSSLAYLDVSTWTVASLENASELFNNCKALTVLDLGAWNTAALKNTSDMFNTCQSLETIKVGDGWNMTNVSASANMFYGCNKLKGSNGTKLIKMEDVNKYVVDKTYARVDKPGAPGYLTQGPAPTTP